ncbi:hypothetical protein [Komagataeibacter sp. FNDCF1]|uniref:hypothetical protein n=1 Tax=Komagataeibacter sp. FNDCF1 TaxID=2878681 RepID=UPI001E4D2CDC|nr:hypothetical protein [Komagataeibacter sp. FNDCF1]MCE2565141.1 hypothetical protein [Komagataeibacter sp. FNDCF1]
MIAAFQGMEKECTRHHARGPPAGTSAPRHGGRRTALPIPASHGTATAIGTAVRDMSGQASATWRIPLDTEP